jgi:hypothetical protein
LRPITCVTPHRGYTTRKANKPAMTEARRPRHAPDFRLETLDNEVLLYHPGQTKAVYLNETASLVWNLCNGERDPGEITELLQEAFPEAAEQIAADVDRVLAEFAGHGAIEYV